MGPKKKEREYARVVSLERKAITAVHRGVNTVSPCRKTEKSPRRKKHVNTVSPCRKTEKSSRRQETREHSIAV